MPAPVVEGFTSATGVDVTSLTLTKPSGVVSGNLLLVLLGNDDTATDTGFVAPSGWTLFQELGDGNTDAHLGVLYRVADGTESATETFSWGSLEDAVGWYIRISGQDTTTVFGADTNSRVESSSTTADLGILNKDSGVSDILAVTLCVFDGGDSDMGHTETGWFGYDTTDAGSNTLLAADGRYLEASPSGASVSAAWTTRASTSNVSSFIWKFAVADGAAAFEFSINGGTFSVVDRTATGSGTGTSTASSQFYSTFVRTATGSGTGTSQNSISIDLFRTAYGSGGATTGDQATGVLTANRSATGTGTGTSSTVSSAVKQRTATGAGRGSTLHASAATGTSQSGSVATFLVSVIRTASSAGTSNQTTIGQSLRARTATGTSNGSSSSTFTKSLIFRPPLDDLFRFANYRYDTIPHRLFGYVAPGNRASNVYKLVDGSFVTVDPMDGTVVATYLGGHNNEVTAEEKADLVAAGYEVT